MRGAPLVFAQWQGRLMTRNNDEPQKPLIACVDDDISVRTAIEGFLKAVGFSAAVFPSAEEFLQYGQLERISCLITDVMLGGMSGLELQTRLAASGHRIPTVVISAFSNERFREQALTAGAVGFLAKPVAKGDLLVCIHSAVAQWRRNGQ
jgi:FixJ family two-component response regulator